MKILVTGGEGYIGKNLILKIKDRYPDFSVDSLDIKDSRIYQDIRDRFILPEYDCVIHLAALVKVGESVQYPWEYYKTNIFGTKNVLNLSYSNFIFASSGSVDGMKSPYAISKKAGEDLVQEECPDYTIFRFYNVLGGFYPQTNQDAILPALKKAVKDGVFVVNGNDFRTPDGTAIRDYVHVDDVCESIIRAIFKPSNSIEGLGMGYGYSVNQIIDVFKMVNGVDFEVKYNKRRPGDMDANYILEPSPYFTPDHSLKSMLKL